MMKLLKSIHRFLKNLINKLRDPTRSLQRHHNRLLVEARDLQRKGDIPAFAAKTREAAEVEKKIDELNKARRL